MSLVVVIAAFWMFAPVFFLVAIVSVDEWFERRRRERDARAWRQLLSLDDAFENMPAVERRRVA